MLELILFDDDGELCKWKIEDLKDIDGPDVVRMVKHYLETKGV